MKIRTFCMILLLFVVLIFFGCVTTTTKSLKTRSGDTITAIYSAPESKGKLPAVIYNHGRFVRKVGYSEAADRGVDVNDFVKALNKEGYVASQSHF